ncbi:MAG: DUF4079 family protein [Myxococcota bacterium]
MDPATREPLVKALAYAHPLWMVASIALCTLALRAGLALRRTRVKRRRRTADLLSAHLRFAKPAVVVIAIGFAAGPISAVWLRDWAPISTFHSWLGIVVFALFVSAAVLGRRLERGRGRPVEAHAILAGLAVLFAAAAAIAGFILLP